MAEPLPFRVDPEAKLVTVLWPPVEPRLDLFRATVEHVLSHPAFQADFGILSDRRAVTTPPRSAFIREAVELLASEARNGRFKGRWATVLMPGDLAIYGMARMMELLSEDTPLQYQVFTDYNEAVAWVTGGTRR